MQSDMDAEDGGAGETACERVLACTSPHPTKTASNTKKDCCSKNPRTTAAESLPRQEIVPAWMLSVCILTLPLPDCHTTNAMKRKKTILHNKTPTPYLNKQSRTEGRINTATPPPPHSPVPGNAPFFEMTTMPRSLAMYPFMRLWCCTPVSDSLLVNTGFADRPGI